ncbi:GlsB/YeaQ/YmgE family stress response membrane protein [Pseudodonghicola flavimaris]|uniref:GlsB/YeaQ/YmgE family stress response membrane protein n=1 Tax=Pseudodonghicola flavimaris TaxID=3050036 RepID=A0ABT7F6L7_9RHOB|nr:GlsB/YeaQ/YmgE family stress response membrane protein [Pseudodonghicola flavimaris]MDK3020241.1 GlsB/YeaQ/YmgE family stress response membrane protein [Pseudodonghicola flavimaris]
MLAGVIGLAIIGAAAGFLATRIMRIEADIPTTMLIGIVGALLGGLVIRLLLTVMGAMAGFVGAVLGALVVIWVWQTYFRRK